jgi:hypothetical protein
MYEFSVFSVARAYGAALIFGALTGITWALLLAATQRFIGFFIFFLALGLGYLFAEVLGWATNRKRGPLMQIAAVFGLTVAYLTRNLVLGLPLVPVSDLFGLLVVGIAAAVAVASLR